MPDTRRGILAYPGHMRITVPSETLRDLLSDLDGVTIDQWDFTDPAPSGRVDLAVMPYSTDPKFLIPLKGSEVAWVQTQTLGYEGLETELPEGIGLSNAVGVHEGPTAELAVGLMIAAQRGFARMVRNQDQSQWVQQLEPGLLGRTVLMIGVGGVGTAIADRLEPFGVNLIRAASRARDDERGHIYGRDDYLELAGKADIVAIAIPLTDATRGTISAEFIAAMKDGALLVNVGRGGLVDAKALEDAVVSGKIRAASDTWDPEPLNQDSPLWSAPGAFISPHEGGRVSTREDRVAAVVREQVALFKAGKPFTYHVL